MLAELLRIREAQKCTASYPEHCSPEEFAVSEVASVNLTDRTVSKLALNERLEEFNFDPMGCWSLYIHRDTERLAQFLWLPIFLSLKVKMHTRLRRGQNSLTWILFWFILQSQTKILKDA